jgi:SOS-response transcriptional repressor LexA
MIGSDDRRTPGARIREARRRRGLTQTELAEACGWSGGQGRVGNYERDEREPSGADYTKLARALNVSPAELQFGVAKHIHHDTSPLGETNVEPGPALSRQVPVISWVRAGSWAEVADPYEVGDAEMWLPVPKRAGQRTFALRVRGISMEPRYQEGDIIFVDPDAEAHHGSRVVVRLEQEKEATFKELVIEGERRYLRALNPAWPDPLLEVTKEAVIVGVVIGKWVDEK